MSSDDVTNGSSAKSVAGDGAKNGDLIAASASACKDIQSSNGNADKDRKRNSSGSSTNSNDFVKVEVEKLTEGHVAEVMGEIRKHHYTPVSVEDRLGLQGVCTRLYRKDYVVESVDNGGGQLSYNYPQELIIPVGRKCNGDSVCVQFDKEKYKKLVERTSVARSRSRFIVPVILCDNKFICRSGTIGNMLTTIYETALKPEPPKTQYVEESTLQTGQRIFSDFAQTTYHKTISVCDAVMMLTRDVMPKLLDDDAELFRDLKIEHICDLMVEYEKRAGSGMLPVSSSEKLNKDQYKDFKIDQMPFPGCEFFKLYHDASRRPEGLVFNWDQPEVDAEFKLSEDANLAFPGLEWDELKTWDVIRLTQAYMKVLLTYVIRDSGGLVVHCISGWDRTPLFISLLRVSLWADGIIHESLNVIEMAFLTLAYDWYLFGHDFPTRHRKSEEIMHFCFNFMQHMASDDFSVTRIFSELPADQKQSANFPEFKAGIRRNRITKVGSLLLRIYDDEILSKALDEESFEKVQMPTEN